MIAAGVFPLAFDKARLPKNVASPCHHFWAPPYRNLYSLSVRRMRPVLQRFIEFTVGHRVPSKKFLQARPGDESDAVRLGLHDGAAREALIRDRKSSEACACEPRLIPCRASLDFLDCVPANFGRLRALALQQFTLPSPKSATTSMPPSPPRLGITVAWKPCFQVALGQGLTIPALPNQVREGCILAGIRNAATPAAVALGYSAVMCANYIPVTSAARLLQFFGVQRDSDEPDHDTFPMGLAPFIRLAPSGTEPHQYLRRVDDGIFRFVPDFIAKLEWARRTYNARTETVDAKATYKKAWADGMRCIIPAEAIYEPNYESGKPVRWRIRKVDGEPMGIAGIYRTWTNFDGEVVFAMSMLTVNADDHPVMRQFHAPDDEKRMVVILEPKDFEGWLTCPVAEAKARYCKQWHGLLVAEPTPLPSRARASKALPKGPNNSNSTGDLF